MKLTDKELKSLPRSCMPFNNKGAVIINKAILKEMCKELLEHRANKGD
ncbi:hypothetical protein ABWK22_02165 [Gottfriedia acidiceleris]